MTKITKVILLLICLTVSLSWAEEKKAIKPSSKDKCPVCGMFVAKYSDFLAAIAFKDGACVFFDGSKDMFKYYFNFKKYEPARKQSDIEAVYVTDYYDLKWSSVRINPRRAYSLLPDCKGNNESEAIEASGCMSC